MDLVHRIEHAEAFDARVEWASPVPGLWVASAVTADGPAYAGTVERLDEGYVLTDGQGHAVGVFTDLAAAKYTLSSLVAR